MTTGMFKITVHNAYQDVGQETYTGFSNNLSFDPTVEEMNRNSSYCGGISDGQEGNIEPLFGAHIREAATTVKKLFSSR